MDRSSDVRDNSSKPIGRAADEPIALLPEAMSRDALERTMVEIEAAIAVVAGGLAVTVALCGFDAADGAAFTAAVWAQAAGVAFRLRREDPGSLDLIFGPRLRPVAAHAGRGTEL